MFFVIASVCLIFSIVYIVAMLVPRKPQDRWRQTSLEASDRNELYQAVQAKSQSRVLTSSSRTDKMVSSLSSPKTPLENTSSDASKVPPTSSNSDLPELYSDKEIARNLIQSSAMQTWIAQDDVMRQWPAYSDVKRQLQAELEKTFDLNNASADLILSRAREFRQKFWQGGGGSSQNSYIDIYKARVLLEQAYSLDTANMTVSDELVETIQAAHPLVTFKKGTNSKTRNVEVGEALLELRSRQFSQIKKETAGGREPTWKDFIRAVDLSVLLSYNDTELAIGVVQWLKDNADQGQWTACNQVFDRFIYNLSQGKRFNFNIYIPTKAEYPKEFRYGRRLPSFRGPNPEKRGLVLWPKDRSRTVNVSSTD